MLLKSQMPRILIYIDAFGTCSRMSACLRLMLSQGQSVSASCRATLKASRISSVHQRLHIVSILAIILLKCRQEADRCAIVCSLFLYHGNHLIKCEQFSLILNTHMLMSLEERHLAASNWYRVALKLLRDQWDLGME